MRIPVAILIILLGVWAVLGYAWATSDAPYATAQTHATHPSMLVSPEVMTRDAPLWKAGAALSGLIVALFTASILLSIGRVPTAGIAKTIILAVALPWITIFTTLVYRFQAYALKGDETFLGSFPIATTLMIGIWGTPILLVILYVVGFSKWFATPEQIEKFNAAIERKASVEAEGTH